MLEIGSVIDGKYKILNVIGKGGMSVVYLAMNEKANKQWAIKEISKDGQLDYEVVRQNLIIETDLLKQLSHKHLPSIVDVIDEGDNFLIVMDYIEGIPLSKKLEEEGALPQESVIDWAKQLCSVLGYLHTRNSPIIYRDLKPANVMLKPDGNIVLIDFGTARVFKESNVEDTHCLGTKGYAAPEQYGGHGQTDARTDIYCLGSTMYHLVTGHNPCDPPYEITPIRQWNASLSSGLEQIILKCTQQNPDERYQSCAELMYALEHYDELDSAFRMKQNRRFKLFLTSAILTVLFGGLAVSMRIAEEASKKNNYEVYMEEAKLEIQESDAIKKYQDAINMEPARSDAYMEMLDNTILNDDTLTEEEALAIRDSLNQSNGNNGTNETYFMTNKSGYEAFSYRMGIAYFYSYEDSGNKSLAKKWLDIASRATTLEDQQVERSKRLYKIADYYSVLGLEGKSGKKKVSYKDYWNDMLELTDGNLVEMDNATTAAIMYKEMVNQIYTNCLQFKSAGVTKEEMQEKITDISKHLNSDFGSIDSDKQTRVKNLIEEIQDNSDLAKQALMAAFNANLEEAEEVEKEENKEESQKKKDEKLENKEINEEEGD